MSATTSKRSLKRLSLLQSPSLTSATTAEPELYEGANEAGPSSAPLPAQRSPKTTDSDLSSSVNNIFERPQTSLKSLKNARRQSSICYFSPDRETSPLASPSLPTSRRLSAQPEQLADIGFQAKLEEKKKKERRRASVQILQRPPTDESCNDPCNTDLPLAARDRAHLQEPLTLAERHADLLRFIAQKESKCLELRQQLAVHEAELAQLKRTWARIVTRGITSSSGSGSSAPSSGTRSAGSHPTEQHDDVSIFSVSAIKESVQGVGRLLAQLGDLGVQGLPGQEAVQPLPLTSSEDAENEGTKGTSPSACTHISNASISASSASSTRHSQSSLSLSLSSIGESLPDGSVVSQDKIRSEVEASDEALVRASVVPSSQKKNTANDCRFTSDLTSNDEPIAISGAMHIAQPIRRKPYESSSPSESTDSLSPLTPNSAPPLNRGFSISSRNKASIGPQARNSVSHMQKQGNSRPTIAPATRTVGTNVPPPSTVPGLSALATVSAIPLPLPAQSFSAFVDTVGKKIGQQLQLHAQAEEAAAASSSPSSDATITGPGSGVGSRSQLRSGSTTSASASSKFTTAMHRRASTLLSGASSSLFAALSPVPAASPSGRSSKNVSTTRAVSPGASNASPAPSSAISLLDGDDDEFGGFPHVQWDSVLSPERLNAPLADSRDTMVTSVTKKSADTRSVSDESEDWNW